MGRPCSRRWEEGGPPCAAESTPSRPTARGQPTRKLSGHPHAPNWPPTCSSSSSSSGSSGSSSAPRRAQQGRPGCGCAARPAQTTAGWHTPAGRAAPFPAPESTHGARQRVGHARRHGQRRGRRAASHRLHGDRQRSGCQAGRHWAHGLTAAELTYATSVPRAKSVLHSSTNKLTAMGLHQGGSVHNWWAALQGGCARNAAAAGGGGPGPASLRPSPSRT